jgi:hypothetical protein
MVEIEVSLKHINLARTHANRLGAIKNSFTNGQGNLIGYLGEVIVYDYLGVKYDSTKHSKDFDLIVSGKKLEIKTKKCSSPPKDSYLCSVASTSMHQDCDYYIFTRVDVNLTKAWILGYISKKDFLSSGFFGKKGEADGKNGFAFKVDCHNIKISDLFDIKKLKDEIAPAKASKDKKDGNSKKISKRRVSKG